MLKYIKYITFLLPIFIIYCDDNNKSDDDNGLPYLRLQVVIVDSLSYNGIVGAFVGLRNNLNDSSIFINDSLKQDSIYYFQRGFTEANGYLIFIFRYTPPPIDVYERMVAYYPGYKKWVFSRSKDTVIDEGSRNVKVIIELSAL